MISAGAPSGGFAGPAGRGSVTGSRLTKVCVAFPSPAPVGTAGPGLDAPPNVVHLSAVDLHSQGDTCSRLSVDGNPLEPWRLPIRDAACVPRALGGCPEFRRTSRLCVAENLVQGHADRKSTRLNS